MTFREPLDSFPDIPIYEENYFDGTRTKTPGDAREVSRAMYSGAVLVERYFRSRYEPGYNRGDLSPAHAQAKRIAVAGILRSQRLEQKRIGRPFFLQKRREARAVARMAKVVDQARPGSGS